MDEISCESEKVGCEIMALKNKRYFWIQLAQDFFKSKEMKLLRKIAGGDTHTIIYLKMMLISLEDGHSLTMSTIPVMRLRRNSKSVNVNYLKGLRMEAADVYFKAWDTRG